MIFGNKTKQLKNEVARLEAFLSAMPGAYCGWSAQGEMAYSDKFLDMLGAESLDDQNALMMQFEPRDAAVLEGHLTALRKRGVEFEIELRRKDREKILRFTGRRGRNLDKDVSYDILWCEDITNIAEEKRDLADAKSMAETAESYLKTVVDNLPYPVWISNHEGKIEWVNRPYTEMVGLTRERVINDQKLLGSVRPKKGKKAEKKESIESLIQRTIDLNMPQSQDNYTIIGGKRVLMRYHIRPLDGRHAALGLAVDISSLEEAETNLRLYMENARVLFEGLKTGIASFDKTHHLEYFNSEFANLWGLEESWLNASPKIGEIMDKLREMRRLPEQADFKRFKESWVDMFTNLMERREEMMHLPDNTTLRMMSIPRPSGGLIITFEDVTGAIELEANYNTLMAVQRESLDNLAEGVAVFGGDGRLKLYNPQYAKIWNLNPETLEGEPHISKLIDKKKHLFNEETVEEAIGVLRRFAFEYQGGEEEIILADGRIILAYSVRLPDGAVMVSFDDITDTVRVENALREKNAALEEAESLKTDFLANVSYQLRTPLNAIMGFAEILSNQYFGTMNERQTEYTQGISDAGQRLLGLIDDILDISTIEAGYLSLHNDSIDVLSMVHNIYDLTQEWARKQSIRVELSCAKNIGNMVGDERRLKQVLINLLRNAITYTPKDGKITIEAKRKRDKSVVLSVIDTGPGIPDEDQGRIFQPFMRGKGGKQSNEGAGLGLSLVKNIIELHGGTVELESQIGKGTKVSIVLPHIEAASKSPKKSKDDEAA